METIIAVRNNNALAAIKRKEGERVRLASEACVQAWVKATQSK